MPTPTESIDATRRPQVRRSARRRHSLISNSKECHEGTFCYPASEMMHIPPRRGHSINNRRGWDVSIEARSLLQERVAARFGGGDLDFAVSRPKSNAPSARDEELQESWLLRRHKCPAYGLSAPVTVQWLAHHNPFKFGQSTTESRDQAESPITRWRPSRDDDHQEHCRTSFPRMEVMTLFPIKTLQQ